MTIGDLLTIFVSALIHVILAAAVIGVVIAGFQLGWWLA